MDGQVGNLYVHFPFCRSRCSYCTLYSRTGITADARIAYVQSIADALGSHDLRLANPLSTIYFGGGSPALCDLSPLGAPLASHLSDSTEFTVELHPLDVTREKLAELKSVGVNRISMGVQSLDDAVLSAMNRGYTADEARRRFDLVKSFFDNAGIDLILGYPGEASEVASSLSALGEWGLSHCSVYSLQNERGLKDVPGDDVVLDRIRAAAAVLRSFGLERYEISNYAVRGRECRHNLAVWRGEDYVGLGEGACGRIGLVRTRGVKADSGGSFSVSSSSVSPDFDLMERTLFRLRTREGLDAARFPQWRESLERFVREGLLARSSSSVYCLTSRGTEVCDSILAELV